MAITKIKSVSFARNFIKGMRSSSFIRQESQKHLKIMKNENNKSDSGTNQIDNQLKEE